MLRELDPDRIRTIVTKASELHNARPLTCLSKREVVQTCTLAPDLGEAIATSIASFVLPAPSLEILPVCATMVAYGSRYAFGLLFWQPRSTGVVLILLSDSFERSVTIQSSEKYGVLETRGKEYPSSTSNLD